MDACHFSLLHLLTVVMLCRVTTEEALDALQRAAARNNQELEQEELEDIAEFYKLKQKQLLKAGSSSAATGGGVGGVGGGLMLLASSSSGSDEEEVPSSSLAGPPGKKSKQGLQVASVLGASLEASVTSGLDGLPEPSKPALSASSAGRTASKSLTPAFKVIKKPLSEKTHGAAVLNVAGAIEQEEGSLAGLLGGYGSSDDSDHKSS
jgi:hypothetical protein